MWRNAPTSRAREAFVRIRSGPAVTTPVRASRGKAIRAEPVAALYEQDRVHHIRYPENTDRFDLLEDQMTSFVPGITQKSPDRMDALVWAITELVIDREEQFVTVLQPLVEISPI